MDKIRSEKKEAEKIKEKDVHIKNPNWTQMQDKKITIIEQRIHCAWWKSDWSNIALFINKTFWSCNLRLRTLLFSVKSDQSYSFFLFFLLNIQIHLNLHINLNVSYFRSKWVANVDEFILHKTTLQNIFRHGMEINRISIL